MSIPIACRLSSNKAMKEECSTTEGNVKEMRELGFKGLNTICYSPFIRGILLIRVVLNNVMLGAFHLLTARGRGEGGQVSYTSLLCIILANRRGGGFQIACKIAYVLNGRLSSIYTDNLTFFKS